MENIRQNNPTTGTTTFNDDLYGDITVDNSELDDMILIKSDGFPCLKFGGSYRIPKNEFIEWIKEIFGTSNPDYANLLACNFGCSDLRNGNLLGRNLDFVYSRMAEFVVKVEANEEKGRFASIGTAIHPYFTEEDVLELEKNGTYSKELETLPYITCDGINENGVACAMNTCSLLDAGKFDHTNEGKEEIFLLYLVRFVLDYATSANHAVSLLESYDITYPYELAMEVGLEDSGHLMIADAQETYIVEFFDNKVVAKKADAINQAEGNVMTNFYNNMSPEREEATYDEGEKICYQGYDKYAEGVERYKKLMDQYDITNDFAGMFLAMKSVRASDTYLSPTVPNWPSDDVDQTIINDETKEVIANGEVAKLTPIEYNILLLLVKNPGKVFSIDDIYEQIWNEEAIGADNTVAVHIRHIREKIELDPKNPRYVKVVWGVGYKVEKQ